MSLRGDFSLYRLFCCLGMAIVFLSGSVCQAELLLRADKPTVVFEQGVKYIAGDTKVVNLQGTWRQMGRQYGKLLDKELRDVYFDKLQPFMEEHPDKKELLQRIAEACYQSNAYKYREMLAGMAETSKLNLEQLKLVNAVEYVGGITQCSGMAAWDAYAQDALVYGRNYDYFPSFKSLNDDIAVVVYHPADGSLAAATIGYVGEIYAVNGMNEKGIFMELNNGGPSADGKKNKERIHATSSLMNFLFDADSMAYAEKFFQTTGCDYSYLIGVADQKQARSYEWRADGVKHGEGQYQDGLMIMCNHFVNPEWQLEEAQDETSWQSPTRVANLQKQAEANKGKIDAAKMQEIMSTNIENGGAMSDLTVYQLVAEPKSKTLWFKGATSNEWTQLDMQSFFEATNIDEQQKTADAA